MANYRSDRSGGRGGFRESSNRYGGRRDYNDRDSGRKEMFSAICDNCGRSCEVPFRPSGDKPVYCSDCFNDRNDSPRSDRREFGRSAPREERGNSKPNNAGIEKILEQLNTMNAKFEKLLDVLEALTEDDSFEEEEEVVEKKPRAKRAKKTEEAV